MCEKILIETYLCVLQMHPTDFLRSSHWLQVFFRGNLFASSADNGKARETLDARSVTSVTHQNQAGNFHTALNAGAHLCFFGEGSIQLLFHGWIKILHLDSHLLCNVSRHLALQSTNM